MPDPVLDAKTFLSQTGNDHSYQPGAVASRVRALHPGAYTDIPDQELERRILTAHPDWQDVSRIPSPQSAPASSNPGIISRIASFANDSLPMIGAAALPMAAAASGPVGWLGGAALALLGGMGGAGFAHANRQLAGQEPVSSGPMEDLGSVAKEGGKAGAWEVGGMAAAPYIGAGMSALGRGQQRLASSMADSGAGKLGRFGIPSLDLLYRTVTGHPLQGMAEAAVEGLALDPRTGKFIQKVGGRMMEPAFHNGPEPDELPGVPWLKKLLNMGDDVDHGFNIKSKSAYNPAGGFGDAAEPIESNIDHGYSVKQKTGPDSGFGEPADIIEPNVDHNYSVKQRTGPDTGFGDPADIIEPNVDHGYSVRQSSSNTPGFGDAAEPFDSGIDHGFDVRQRSGEPSGFGDPADIIEPNIDHGFSVRQSSGAPSGFADPADVIESNVDHSFQVRPQSGVHPRATLETPPYADVAEEAPSFASAQGADIPQAPSVLDPLRKLLPGLGETSETGFAKPPLRPESRTIDLANELIQERLGPGAKVTSLKTYPKPEGADPLAKALRQRKHIATAAGKSLGYIPPALLAAIAGLESGQSEQ